MTNPERVPEQPTYRERLSAHVDALCGVLDDLGQEVWAANVDELANDHGEVIGLADEVTRFAPFPTRTE